MENKKSSTKQMIKETALTLFSERGYQAVSIRDIGKIVGVKESTIYYHFENKKDIFNSLVQDIYDSIDAKDRAFKEELAKIGEIKEEEFIWVGVSLLENFFLNELILKFCRMLMLERHVDEVADKLYQRIFFVTPLEQNETVFTILISKKIFHNLDPKWLAMIYYTPIYAIFNRYFSRGEVTEDKKLQAFEEIKLHLKEFYTLFYTKTKGEGVYESI